jgi:hypothetical protein
LVVEEEDVDDDVNEEMFEMQIFDALETGCEFGETE